MKSRVPEQYNDVQEYYQKDPNPKAIFEKLSLVNGHESPIDVFLCFAPDFRIGRVEFHRGINILNLFYDELFKYDDHMYRISLLSAGVFAGGYKQRILESQMDKVCEESLKLRQRPDKKEASRGVVLT